MNMINYQELRERIFAIAKAEGFENCEIYISDSQDFSLRANQGEISEYKNASSFGLSFRGSIGGKMGYAFSESTDEQALLDIIRSAKANAAIIEGAEVEELFGGSQSYPMVKTYNPALNEVSVEDKIATVLKMEQIALDYDPRIVAVDYSVLSTGESSVYIANTLGMEVGSSQNYMYAYIYARAESDGQMKTGGDVFSGDDWSKFDPEALAKTAAKNALKQLGAESMKSSKYKVMLDPMAAGDFLATFAPVFFADNVQKGLSLLGGKLGNAIASPAVTLRDDALLDGMLGSSPFDSEGVACANKAIIKNGVLETFLHNLKSAKKDGVASTGNGFKASYKSTVTISATNFYIEPSDKLPEALLAEMGDGVLITDLAGLHSGANAISGDFSLSADGFVVENGKITRAVEQVTVAGNFFELLNNVVAVANDLKFTLPSGVGNVASPSLYVSGLDIAGL